MIVGQDTKVAPVANPPAADTSQFKDEKAPPVDIEQGSRDTASWVEDETKVARDTILGYDTLAYNSPAISKFPYLDREGLDPGSQAVAQNPKPKRPWIWIGAVGLCMLIIVILAALSGALGSRWLRDRGYIEDDIWYTRTTDPNGERFIVIRGTLSIPVNAPTSGMHMPYDSSSFPTPTSLGPSNSPSLSISNTE
ncbi:hypothetical protein CC1G_02510 [Coprinopsis cinerea okayama7|uniref:Uncharacterized protein n=1 Tax=Coprinopsis cinerea (strain Okayama-7 / 130 / ATCC MYA-4618 / FGSC 9003) TaxID=240176 RepID=A8NBQ0_COPC7|nr:hypothetical protein CC1G_02510 [Coprinopsis cinerea okayama7\|eukprot:XP_001832248.2 hypothetical protein CC1G_02510 [Coprinopsis cinerea okayama7\